MLSKEEIKSQIARMGINKNDTVVIHTSLKKVGEIYGGADTLIDAFCEYLSDGLFLVPTHTWATVGPQNPVFDVRNTLPCIGALPRAAAAREDGVRSLHPSHSIWAYGKNAAQYVEGEENVVTPTPPDGCWGKLAKHNAKILLIGVRNDKNTFIHTIDEEINLPDRVSEGFYTSTLIDKNGKEIKGEMHEVFCSRSPDVSVHFTNFEDALTYTGAQHFGTLGNAEVRIVDAALCRKTILRIYEMAQAPGDICIADMEIPKEYYI